MLYAVAGIILITVGLCLLISERYTRLRCSKSVTGKIAYIETRQEAVGRGTLINYYYPVYEYELDGQIYHGKPRQYSKYENWYQIGDCAGNPADLLPGDQFDLQEDHQKAHRQQEHRQDPGQDSCQCSGHRLEGRDRGISGGLRRH